MLNRISLLIWALQFFMLNRQCKGNREKRQYIGSKKRRTDFVKIRLLSVKCLLDQLHRPGMLIRVCKHTVNVGAGTQNTCIK